jgi:hypothetical protein
MMPKQKIREHLEQAKQHLDSALELAAAKPGKIGGRFRLHIRRAILRIALAEETFALGVFGSSKSLVDIFDGKSKLKIDFECPSCGTNPDVDCVCKGQNR